MKKITTKEKARSVKKGLINQAKRAKTRARNLRIARKIHGVPLSIARFLKTTVK